MKLHRNRIKELCKERGITMKYLAEQLGYNKDKMYNYTHGANVPRQKAQDIADYFDVSIYEIIQFVGFDY